MVVKGNHPSLEAVLPAFFEPPLGRPACQRQAQTREKGHGRIEWRRLTTTTVGVSALAWPGVSQVFRLERRAELVRRGKVREEIVYGLTSVSPQRAGAARLLRWTRGQWGIENRSHWVRDVTFDEDHSTVRCGSIPQVLAGLRNVAIGLLRRAGHANIARAGRYYAAHPAEALALLGLLVQN
jgi:hypothetical protein